MIDWSAIIIGGVAVAPLIVALIEVLKNHYGLDIKYAPALCGILSIVAYVVSAIIIPAYPEVSRYAQWVVGALVVFLTATGAYKVSKQSGNN